MDMEEDVTLEVLYISSNKKCCANTNSLEGSPLDEYLHSFGEDSFADARRLQCYNQIVEKKAQCVHGFFYGLNIKDYFQHTWKTLRMKISQLFPVSEEAVMSMSHIYHRKYGNVILHSSVVLEDDLDYLCLRLPHQFLGLVKQNSVDNIFKNGHMTTRAKYAVFTLFVVTCCMSCLSSDFLPVLARFFIGACLALIFMFYIRLQIITELWKKQHEANLLMLKHFITTNEKMNKVIKKSLQLIKEMEVVLHGYKLLNGRTPITRIEQAHHKSNRSFSKLRCAVVRCAKQCIASYRKSCIELLDYKSLDETIDDAKPIYLCQIPMHEFWKNLDDSFLPFNVSNGTDECSLSTLKQLNDLLSRQRSELLTLLSLVLSTTSWDFTKDGFLCNFPRILNEPCRTSSDCCKFLQSSYEMHKYYAVTSPNQKKMDCSKGHRKTSALTLNLHSMQVHLRAAMYTTMQLEVDVAKGRAISQVELDAVKRHLDSSNDCWDESLKQLCLAAAGKQPAAKCGDCADSRPPAHARVLPSAVGGDDRVQPVQSDDETDFSDQIFEATTESQEGDDLTPERTLTQDDVMSSQVVAESSEVLKELRSVLAVKTSEQQREMWKKQLFPTYVPKEAASKAEPLSKIDAAEQQECASCDHTRISARETDDEAEINVEPPVSVRNHEAITDSPEEPGTDSRLPPQQTNQLSDDEVDAAFDAYADNNLKVFKRALSVGRPPSLRQRRKNSHRRLPEDGERTVPNIEQHSARCRVNSEQDPAEDDRSEWSSGLGLGFSNALAAQAVLLARRRPDTSTLLCSTPSETITYGSDSDTDIATNSL